MLYPPPQKKKTRNNRYLHLPYGKEYQEQQEARHLETKTDNEKALRNNIMETERENNRKGNTFLAEGNNIHF